MKFENKTVLVTGSTQGIGREIALKFGAEGAAVMVNGIDTASQKEMAEEVCALIRKSGGKAEFFLADVSDAEQADAMVRFTREQFGSIDVIVNNAGITRDNLLMRMSEAEWDSVLSVNLKGAFHVIRSAAKILMKQRGGAAVISADLR